jgi:hypothetical protein
MTEPLAPASPQPETPPSSHPATPTYEFTSTQHGVIRSLSQKMKFVGIFYVLASALVGLAAIAAMFFSPLIGLLYLVILTPELLIGIWTIHSANSFQMVVETSGRDIPHLMNALTALRKLYTLMFWLLIAALVFMVLAMAVGLFLWTSGFLQGHSGNSTFTGLQI